MVTPRHTIDLILPRAHPLDCAALLQRLSAWRPGVEQLGSRALFSVPGSPALLVHVFDTPEGIAIAVIAHATIHVDALRPTVVALIDTVLAPLARQHRDRVLVRWTQARSLRRLSDERSCSRGWQVREAPGRAI